MRKRIYEIFLIVVAMSLIYQYAEGCEVDKQEGGIQGISALVVAASETSVQILDKTVKAYVNETQITESMAKDVLEQMLENETTEMYQEVLQSAQLDWKWIIEPGEYDDLYFLGGKYIAVQKENGKYSVIDENGEFVFSEEYDSIAAYSEQTACVKSDGEYFYINENGKRVIEGDFCSARNFHEERAAIEEEEGWGFIDLEGNLIVKCQYEQVHDFHENCAVVKRQGTWGCIGYEGELIVPCRYDEVRNYSEGLAAVRQGNLWGFVDKKGEMTVECQYDEVKDYREGMAAVKKDGKWGYIDKEGQIAILLAYDDAGSFSEGKAAVKQECYTTEGFDAWAYINQENGVVIDFRSYSAAGMFRLNVGEFRDGLAFVSDVFPCIINEKGEYVFDGSDSFFLISDLVYDEKYNAIPAYVFADDAMREKKYGLVGTDGSCLLEPIFDYAEAPYGDYVKVGMKVGEKQCYGVIKLTGIIS